MFIKNNLICLMFFALMFFAVNTNISAEESVQKESSESLVSDRTLFFEMKTSNMSLDNFGELNYLSSNFSLNSVQKPSYKSPWVAFFLSYVIPGCGQIYNGEIIKGLLFTGTFVLGAAIALLPAIGATSGSEWPTSSYIGVGIAGIAYVWQLIDAPISASRINEENNLSMFRIDIIEGHDLCLGVKSKSFNYSPEIEWHLSYFMPLF